MKLNHLIQEHAWQAIVPVFVECYSEYTESLDTYEEVFSTLKRLAPKNSPRMINISYVHDARDGEEYVNLSGLDPEYQLTDEDRDRGFHSKAFGLEFTPWDEWLGMEIPDTVTKNFTDHEIISHCLHEMTLMGADG